MSMQPLDIVIAGAQRAGTTSVARQLERHPLIVSHAEEEFAFFVEDDRYHGGYEIAFRKQFPRHIPHDGVVLAKSAGIMFLEKAAIRLRDHNADCKIVVCLRDPVDRAYSAFWYERKAGREPASSFEEALRLEEERLSQRFGEYFRAAYISRGMYAEQIRRLYELFPREHVHVLIFEQLLSDQRGVLERLCAALELPVDPDVVDAPLMVQNAAARPRHLWLSRLARERYAASARLGSLMPVAVRRRVRRSLLWLNEGQFHPPPMNAETRVMLENLYSQPNEDLRRLLDVELPGWS